MKNHPIHLTIIICSLFFAACSDGTVIDEYKEITEGVWSVDSLASFEFVIEDTTVDYSINYNVRYAAQYPYYNLYITYYLEDSAQNLLQSELQNLILFDKKDGKPLGDGMGDLFDREIPIFDKYQFKVPGKYQFKVKQFMRMEELPGILSFGLKIKEVREE